MFKQRRDSVMSANKKRDNQIRISTVILLGMMLSSFMCTITILMYCIVYMSGLDTFSPFSNTVTFAQEVLVAVNSGFNIFFYMTNPQFRKTLQAVSMSVVRRSINRATVTSASTS